MLLWLDMDSQMSTCNLPRAESMASSHAMLAAVSTSMRPQCSSTCGMPCNKRRKHTYAITLLYGLRQARASTGAHCSPSTHSPPVARAVPPCRHELQLGHAPYTQAGMSFSRGIVCNPSIHSNAAASTRRLIACVLQLRRRTTPITVHVLRLT